MPQFISVPVDPKQDVATRRFLQQIADAINSLIRAKLLVYDGPGDWKIAMPPGSFVSSFDGRTGAVTLTLLDVTTALGFAPQPHDADLDALAALTGTNTIYYRSAANTWSPVTISTGLSFIGGALSATAGLSIGETISGGRSDGSLLYDNGNLAESPSSALFWDESGTGPLGSPTTLYIGDGGFANYGQIALWDSNNAQWYSAFVDGGILRSTTDGFRTKFIQISDNVSSQRLFIVAGTSPASNDNQIVTLDNSIIRQWRISGLGFNITTGIGTFSSQIFTTGLLSSDLFIDECALLPYPTSDSPSVRFRIKDNGSTVFNIAIPMTLFSHHADQGNVTTGETDLYSDTIPKNRLAANDERLEAEYGGVFVSSGTATREIRLYFGGTMFFDSGALTLSLSSAWTVYVTIIRVSATVVRYMASMTTEGAALAAYTAVGEITGLTLESTTITNILKITGQAAGLGAATNDIVAKLGRVSWHPGP